MIETVPVTAEPLSPELVLVSPELREQVLHGFRSRMPWEVVPQRIVPLWSPQPEVYPVQLLHVVRMAAVAVGITTSLTLALTLIADAVR